MRSAEVEPRALARHPRSPWKSHDCSRPRARAPRADVPGQASRRTHRSCANWRTLAARRGWGAREARKGSDGLRGAHLCESLVKLGRLLHVRRLVLLHIDVRAHVLVARTVDDEAGPDGRRTAREHHDSCTLQAPRAARSDLAVARFEVGARAPGARTTTRADRSRQRALRHHNARRVGRTVSATGRAGGLR